MALAISGIGIVSALGCGIQSFKDGLSGKKQPNMDNMEFDTPAGRISLPVYRAKEEGLETFVPKRALRRVDPFARMALLSSFQAVEDAGIEFPDKSRVGVVFGSGHGALQTTFNFLDGIIEDGDKGASPTHFANSVHNALASQVSNFMKLTGPCSTVTCFHQTVSQVLFMAESWLAEGTVDYVLAGFGDEFCDVLGYAAAGFSGNTVQENQPLNFERCSFSPGQGHVTFLLSSAETDTKYGKLNLVHFGLSAEVTNEFLSKKDNPVYLAANGNQIEGASYSQLKAAGETASHAHIFGSMPLGAAFEIAVAAIDSKQTGQKISCVEYAGRERFNLYSISE